MNLENMPRISKMGNSHGLLIPAQALTRANLAQGDDVVMAPLQDGLLVAARESATGAMVSAMLDAMDTYAETYRVLASEQLSDGRASEDET